MSSQSMNENGPFRLPEVDRRVFLRGALAAGASLSAAGLLAACGGGGSTSAQTGAGAGGGSSATVSKGFPSYYPKDYQSIVDAAKKENGLTIYSNMAEYNWQPIIDAFKQKYPFVGDISTNNLDSAEVFQRYYAESSSGKSAASFMVSGDPTSWIEFIKKHQAAADYTSPELPKLPDFAAPLPNLYTFSTDPILLAYNKALLKENERPKGMKDLAAMVKKDPSRFQHKLTTYDVQNSFGFAIEYVWSQKYDGAWDLLDTILPMVRPEQSSGPMVDKINSGEYLAGFFMSSTVVLPQAEKSGAILGWNYIADGTPMMFRGMGIPKTAPQMATAKLMLDFLLSHDGQIAIYKGGFTPFRKDLTKDEAPRSYSAIAQEVGKDNLINVGYEEISTAQNKAFVSKWNGAMKA
ncbi:MAG TPA: extracellular solute-binding protein [Segeticoccus sp.]|uniref:ABC transporter substrate-binding protein n=1 Tax=Segeticoccus sp. TaxID=2706531 RepID=UPI002D80D747|nr:extracellular solute-binding protein [Segeticoccus sp.]HET8601492.1 extracellular solute-binding protein [Segeticoccus sp.]